MLPIFIFLFLLLQLFSLTSSNNDLNCDFLTTCCWKEPTQNPFINDILASDIIDLNWYHRTFKVGKSKPPPAKNYLLRSINPNTTATPVYESCPFCSENGIVNIEFRHWQSPSTKFYICFKEMDKPVDKENCELVNFILQSKLVDVEFEVEKRTKTTLVFMVSNPSINSEATVMIDHINVRTAYCGLNIKSLKKVVKQETKLLNQITNNEISLSKAPSSISLTEVLPAFDEKRTIPPKKIIALDKNQKFSITPKHVPVESFTSNPLESFKAHQIPNNVNNVPKTIQQPLQNVKNNVSPFTTIPTSIFTFPTLPPTIPSLSIPSGGLFSFLPNSLQPMTPEFTGFNIKPSKVQKSTTKPVLNENSGMPTVTNEKVSNERKSNIMQLNSAPTMSLPTNSKNIKSTGDNPFVEMFGQEFADFLDPTFETHIDEEKEKKINEQNIAQNKVNDGVNNRKEKNVQSNTINIFDPKNQACNTVGGCLFDRSFCSYNNVPDLANGGEFKVASVGNSRFIEAKLNPGQVAVFESKTNMLEDHFVLFDALEWVEGEKLSGCCIVPNRQPSEMICPYESSIFKSSIEWKAGQMVCPKGTNAIMFICENYGKNKGVCAIDNIRLHKTTDISRSEPCQKNLLMKM